MLDVKNFWMHWRPFRDNIVYRSFTRDPSLQAGN